MGSPRRNDWDEKTVMNDLPATQFAAEESGDRRVLRGIFDEDDLEATCVREVPSSVMRAAMDLESTLELPAGQLPDLGQVPLEPVAPAPEPAPQSHLRRRAGVSPMIAALVIGTTLAMATAAVVIASMAMHF